MAITINSNLNALRAIRQLDSASSTLSAVQERLASGQRINSASDDPAGLSIATSLDTKSRVYTRGIANTNDALSLINIATGATDALTNIMTRLNELAIQASNGTYADSQRQALNQEAQALIKEHDRIIKSTTFNGMHVFSTENKSLSIQAGDSAISVNLSAEVTVGDFNFTAPTVYTEATSAPLYTVSGDFNGDGNLDLAGINASEDGYANIFLGNGDGTFATPISYYVGSNSGTTGSGYQGTIQTADLNGDGNLDIVFGKTDGFTTLMGNSDGTFYAGRSMNGTGFTPQGIVSADFNNDGIQDVAVSQSAYYTQLFLGNGDGTFKTAISLANVGSALRAEDVNGDGNVDMIYSNRLINLGHGDGTFTAYGNVLMPGAPNIGDLNGDGLSDISITPGNQNYTRIFLANGDGTFAAGMTITHLTVATPQAKFTDIDQDGVLDLVVADTNGLSLLAYRGNGDGTFEGHRQLSLPTYALGRGLIMDDLNHDGIIDIVSAGMSGASWYSVMLGNGTVADRAGEQRLLGNQAIKLGTRSDAKNALGIIQKQFNFISAIRTSLGSGESRMHVAGNVLSTMALQYKTAESRIADTDIAEDVAQATSATIRQRAAAAVLAQANQQPALAMRLLSSSK